MKTKITAQVLLISSLLIACKDSPPDSGRVVYSSLETEAPNLSKPDSIWRPFVVQTEKVNDFFVLSSSVGDPKAPRSICYLFNGQITNNNETIYSKATITANLFFELENGKIIRDHEMNDNFFGGVQALQVFSQWKQGETRSIGRLISRTIPVAYAEYPVKHVYVRFYIETIDQINDEKKAGIIAEDDITDKWDKAVEKVLRKQIDDNDYNFPKKVIGPEGRY